MQKTVQQWLNLVCHMLPGVIRAVVVVPGRADLTAPGKATASGKETDESNILAHFPESPFDSAELRAAAMLAARRGVPTMSAAPTRSLDSDTQTNHNLNQTAQPGDLLLAIPLKVASLPPAVVSVQLNAGVEHHAVVNQIMAWGESWLQLLLERPSIAESDKQATSDTSATSEQPVRDTTSSALNTALELDQLDSAFAGGGAKAAAVAANLLKDHFACERVCIGLGQAGALKLAAVSDIVQFDGRVNQLRDIEQQMRRRCAAPVDTDQQGDENTATPGDGEAAVLVVPLIAQQQCWGALALQRQAIFSQQERTHIDALAKGLAAQFALQQVQQRFSLAALKQRGHNYLQQLIGPGFFKTKLLSAALAFSLLFLVVIPGEYRVAAPASLEGKIQRAVVAPFDGYIATSLRKAGETVSAGEVIAELDQRQIALERARWLSERAELGKQFRKALAELDHAEAQILKAQIAQATARIDLVNQQMQRAQLIAPIDGIIIAGDLSRSLGAPVERGEVLFEVAPLNEYRIVLQVNEREIRDIAIGQQGWLSLTALAGERIPFVIEQVATVFEQKDGEVLYRTEARVTQPVEFLRPGMQGTGKISVASRSYGYILFHDMFAWLGLKLWSLLP